MLVYWSMFLVAAGGALAPLRLRRGQSLAVWTLIGVVFALLIGFRYEVGTDWFRYLYHFDRVASMTFIEALTFKDPGYYGTSWIVSRLGGDKTWVNFVCAIFLMWGTVVFCRAQAYPWVALLAAVPYMLIVVGMGYTRQGAALGCVLLGLRALTRGWTPTFFVLVLIGATFHKSAVMLLPIAALASSKNRALTVTLVVISMVAMYYLLIESSVEFIWDIYVERQMESAGGGIRVTMNAIPAVILLILRKRIPEGTERGLWVWMAIFALACVPLLSLASTAVDRIALFMIPLQMYAFALLPRLVQSGGARSFLVAAMTLYFGLVLYVWLNFSTHSQYWLPYRFAFFL